MHRMNGTFVRAVLPVVVLAIAAGSARAEQLPNPTITASADPFSPQYVADNVFDSNAAEFATSGNGAGTPLSTDPNTAPGSSSISASRCNSTRSSTAPASTRSTWSDGSA